MKIKVTLIVLFYLLAMTHLSCIKNPASPEVNNAIIEESDPIVDIEGNIYTTIKVGEEIWMAENLNVSYFRNGEPIPEVKTKEDWIRAGEDHEPAWCYYENDSENGEKYGKLYNWYAITDPRGIEPEGWRLASNSKWSNLINNLGGADVAGKKMKATTGWGANGNGDNSGKFTGIPGGGRTSVGDFADRDHAAAWWSSSQHSAITAWGYNVVKNASSVYRGYFDKTTGLSVRAVYCPACSDDTTAALTLSEKLQKALDNSCIGVGISAAVIMPDGETWLGTSGVSHGTTEIEPQMRFAAGSIGKIFTATAILQLAEEGSLTLEDSLYEWLPSYPNIDSTITIRQLLSHTGGIHDFADNPAYWEAIFADPEKVWTPEEIISNFTGEPVYPKGTDWNYSTVGYNMLRMIIMDATDSDLPAVYSNRFWIPLGLNNTFTLMDESLPADIAHGWYDLNNDGVDDDFYSWPRTAFATGIGGEIWTTAEDLAKWSKALFIDKTVISQSMLDQALTFYAPCTGEEFVCAGYGLGVGKFNPQLMNGLEAYGHSGNAPGYAATTMYLPDYQVCIGIMDNTEYGESIGSCASALLDVITTYLTESL